MPGVVRILFARDIPGKNSFITSAVFPPLFIPEPLFVDDHVDYAGQALGLVVANSHQEAVNAAKAVKVTYKEAKKPVLTIRDAIEVGSFFDPPRDDFKVGNPEEVLEKSEFRIDSEIENGGQYHFYMENHVAITEPYETSYK
jgi:xanthine dehydrogenase molybdopterin-binding subunit B